MYWLFIINIFEKVLRNCLCQLTMIWSAEEIKIPYSGSFADCVAFGAFICFGYFYFLVLINFNIYVQLLISYLKFSYLFWFILSWNWLAPLNSIGSFNKTEIIMKIDDHLPEVCKFTKWETLPQVFYSTQDSPHFQNKIASFSWKGSFWIKEQRSIQFPKIWL